jgi:hypothetical protein
VRQRLLAAQCFTAAVVAAGCVAPVGVGPGGEVGGTWSGRYTMAAVKLGVMSRAF